MAVGTQIIGDIYPVQGVKLGVTAANIKYADKKDLVVIEIADDAKNASVAGVFTTNKFCAAPVQIAQKHLKKNPRYLLINTGYANAGTGAKGYEQAIDCCQALAELQNVNIEQVLPFSTGVIGENLPVDSIVAGIPDAIENLSEDNWPEAASGIMTTDTRPKVVSVQTEIEGKTVSITGISKGAGMIRPNMATMLSFVATDADISEADLQHMLTEATEKSFNRITIDGDTSTNDACIAIATGASGAVVKSAEAKQKFAQAFQAVMLDLALAIVKDGEGATKCVAIAVQEAQSTEEACDIAFTIAHSPLVKTALFACDPNWGRIIAAIGRAPIKELDVDKVRIFLNGIQIVESGALAENYIEAKAAEVMQQDHIVITVQMGRGDVKETVWTTDFSYDYVKINAEYRS